jgi:hypothetical protein
MTHIWYSLLERIGTERYVGAFMFGDFVSFTYVYVWMDFDSIFICCVCRCGAARSRGGDCWRFGVAGACDTVVGIATGERETSEGKGWLEDLIAIIVRRNNQRGIG